MATRGVVVSTNTSDDSNSQSEEQRVLDVEAFLAENPIPDDAVNLICRLPSMCSLLTSNESLDCLSTNELLTVSRALKINASAFLTMKSRRSRDRGLQTKTHMLTLIAEKFGEQWTTLYDIAKEMKNSSRSLRRRKPQKVMSTYSFDSPDSKLSGNRSEINTAISFIQKSQKMPTRDELIFLNDDEYETALQFYRATHPEIIDINDLPQGNDATTLQHLYGVVKETTDALKGYLKVATNARTFIDRIEEHQKRRNGASLSSAGSEGHNLSSIQLEGDSSEEHTENLSQPVA
ncbi:hypothetical protein TRFO_42856 [Tritrichomonas foetus]|uniref:Uncharacterized protein n=1 Tax=Tritrichomonas foetus TaxID=1144522 RepID=A0A1J4KVD9_9EUKA|nr:hypothetical protein TRFO_42864 [Tritrichomonas foetus]OHT14868.1 hypothetical protein TRFO_42856 [Tritrichomonas foetus]|eukprot:OHT14864.1 hypothetical protein TRFO_42864 [Tritrichomonas foetus]